MASYGPRRAPGKPTLGALLQSMSSPHYVKEKWIGPRLDAVLVNFSRIPLDARAGVNNVVNAWHAAIADAREWVSKKRYNCAVNSYVVALNLVHQLSAIIHPEMMDVAIAECISVCINAHDFEEALNWSKVFRQRNPSDYRGFLLMSQAFRHLGQQVNAACSLLDGLDKCMMVDNDISTFISEACIIITRLKTDMWSGQIEPGYRAVFNFHPKCLLSFTKWSDVIRRLYEIDGFVEMSLITVGIPGPNLSCLDGILKNTDFSCSGIDVETVYTHLSTFSTEEFVMGLATEMSLYLIDRGADVSLQSAEPPIIKLVNFTLTSRNPSVLKHVLTSAKANGMDLDALSLDGDSALHIVLKQRYCDSFTLDVVVLLTESGALPNILDQKGKIPEFYLQFSECDDVDDDDRDNIRAVLFEAANFPCDGFKQRISRLKAEGNSAHRAKKTTEALKSYKAAIALIEKSPYCSQHHPSILRELAILYNNMAIVHANNNDIDLAAQMAKESIKKDSAFFKPYWRLGKILLEKGKHLEACKQFITGLSCPEVDSEQKVLFLQEICNNFSSMKEEQIEMFVKKMAPHFSTCWPKIVESLSKNSAWDVIRRLVLGPPRKTVGKSALPVGWKYANCLQSSSDQQVGYAMLEKATTPVLHTLVEVVENNSLKDIKMWATDLILALLIQGAQLNTIVVGDEETGYHMVVHICCMTEKTGLLHYMLSEESMLKQARLAVNKEKRTLLHSVCLEFNDGSHLVGQELVKLLLDKGFDPGLRDVLARKAIEYLAPRSTMYQILSKPPVVASPANTKDLKEQGNEEFKKGNYTDACELYSKAIELMLQKLPGAVESIMGHKEDNHELAVLFSNRAECHLKLGRIDAAHQDALDCVAWDAHWFRGHVRVGRVLVQKNAHSNAVRAFANAFNALEKDASEAQRKDILKELLQSLMKINDEPPKRIPQLGYVPGGLWAKISYDYYCEGFTLATDFSVDPKLKFSAAKFSYLLFKTCPPVNELIKVDLAPFCCKSLPSDHRDTVMDLMIFFLERGSDHSNLTFYPGGTYIHAITTFTVLSGNCHLFDWVMKNRAKPQGEENLQDTFGDTALHMVAQANHASSSSRLPTLQNQMRYNICEILLNCGVNPRIRNNKGQTALDCLSPSDDKKLRSLFEAATRAAPEPVSSKSFSSSATRERTDSSGSQYKEYKKAEPKTPAPSKSKTTIEPTGNRTSQERDGESPSKSFTLQCNRCVEYITMAKSFFQDNEKIKIAYSKLVDVLSYKHQKDSRHEKFVGEAVHLLVQQLGKSLNPDIPGALLKISENHLQKILEKLASSSKWRQLDAVVEKFQANDVPRGKFARNISVLALIEDKGLCGAELQRVKILQVLLNHGASFPSNRSSQAVTTALHHEEYRTLDKLIELGADPHSVKLESGDTPLHAALNIALEKDKGNFDVLNRLFSLFDKDHKVYKYLDPQCVDKAGNNLLHLATQARYSKYSHKAVELLVSRGVPVDARNSSGKMPIDYLTGRTDRRIQYLRVAGLPGFAASTAFEEKDKKDLTVNRFSNQAWNEPETESTGEIVDWDQVKVKQAPKRAKNVLDDLNTLIRGLKEITASEARTAKASKKKWLDVDEPAEVDSSHFLPGANTKKIIVDETKTELSSTASVPTNIAWSLDDENDDDEEVEEDEEEMGEGTGDFDCLDWEVECTAEVWKTLRDKHVPQDVKQKAVHRIQLLASGEWRRYLCIKIHLNVPDTLHLYKAKLGRGMYVIWELAIAFSPRLSDDAEKRINEEVDDAKQFAVRGGRIYTEVIRVWDIVLHFDRLTAAVERIVQSHRRGEDCLIQRHLRGEKSEQFEGGIKKRYPLKYVEADLESSLEVNLLKGGKSGQLQLYPPASSGELEFHILKFYSFSAALVYNILKNIEMKIDFPFRVTDKEHAIIHLRCKAPILLLGRSGTGKTTCCLYRLWSRFLTYWTKSEEMEGAPWLPRDLQYIVKEDKDSREGEDVEMDPNAELFEDDLESEELVSASGPNPSASGAGSYDGCQAECGVEGDAREELQTMYDHLHQLFVTKNQVLCSEVQKNFRELCHANDIVKQHVAVEDSQLPHRLQDVGEYKFPLFLTSRQLILMLDASLPPPHFFERNEDDGSLQVTIQGWGADEEIFAFVPLEDDSEEEEEGEDEYYDDEIDEMGDGGDKQSSATHKAKKKDNRREVTYEAFAHEIWPKIIKKSKEDYHPSLVWTEITSFIKGSFEALSKKVGYLDREGYKNLGRKQAPNFSGNRDKVYDLFVRYLDYKQKHGLYDEGDLVFNIYKRLQSAGPLPWILHQVFVDETQDFTQAELTLLIRLAQNPNDMFLTGDTAQSIMRGVSFRFSDLKRLFFYAKQSLKARGKIGALEVPKQVYQLTHNYRSHAGILTLACAVLDILVEFFPESFDRLEKDQGLFDGPLPVVLESCSSTDLAILLTGNKRKTAHIEFGAHQVILVVNEEARNSLPEELSLALVLTIYEAKGLEFDDVLLYNFFKDSQAGKEWRIVTDYLERLSKNLVTSNADSVGLVEIDENVLKQSGRPRPLNFDPNQHKILNSELKHLYTAVTRARVNVWIFDQSEEKRAPMFEYFKARKLARFAQAGESSVSESLFAEKSSPEDWEKRGDEMMGRSLYSVAAKCYTMAKSRNKHDIALAHHTALEATQQRSNPPKMRETFLRAALQFLECHQDIATQPFTLTLRFNLVRKAALCLQNARESYLAAQVFQKNGLPDLGAPLYVRARKFIEASQCFEQIDNYSRAVRVLDEQEMYDQAIDCLQRYQFRIQDLEKRGLPMPKSLLDHRPGASLSKASLTFKAAEFHHRMKNAERMLAAVERLPHIDEQIQFLKSHGYLEHAVDLMRKEGRITEAARLMLHNGKVSKALEIAEEGTDTFLKAQCYRLMAQEFASKMTKKKSRTASVPDSGSKEELSKSSSTGSKTIKEDQSSDEDENESMDYETVQTVIDLLENARLQFDLSKDLTGVGECQLSLASIRKSKDLLIDAFNSFNESQPFSNKAGMLECAALWLKFKGVQDVNECHKLLRAVADAYEVVQVLIHPQTAEDTNRQQMYLNFYGLEKTGEGKLVLYPRMKPRCVRMIGSKNLFKTKDERKMDKLEKSTGEMCLHLGRFILQRTKEWKKEAEFEIQKQIPSIIQCRNYQEGQVCDDDQMCPYLHTRYSRNLTVTALNLLALQVRLDNALQCGAETMIKTEESLAIQAEEMISWDRQWISVENFLEFILPLGVLTYDVQNVIGFFQSVHQKNPVFRPASHQVGRYLNYLWDNPGRVGRGKSTNVLKERCKSSEWIVLASLLSPLFLLDVKVAGNCTALERDLLEKRPKWVRKRKKYALLVEGDFTILIARRHLDALEFLQPARFDPFESVIKFTKFVKLLSDRAESSLMPDFHIFLFWLESFTTIAFCIAAKIQGNIRFVLPECYLRNVELLSFALLPNSHGLLKYIHHYKLKRKQELWLIHERIQILVGVLVRFNTHFNMLRYMVETLQKQPINPLLTERVMLLVLFMLVNIEQGSVPCSCEKPIITAINSLRKELVEALPLRLSQLIQNVQTSSGYNDVIQALRVAMDNMQERILLCQWHEDKVTAFQTTDISNLKSQGHFNIDQTLLQEYQMDKNSDETIAAQFSEDVEEMSVEQVEEISEEEKARFIEQQEEVDKVRLENRQKAAVGIIFKFFKAIIFRKRCLKIKHYYYQQIEKDVFKPFIMTDQFCGICGLRYHLHSSAEQSSDGQMEMMDEEAVKDAVSQQRQNHLCSEEHRMKMKNYQTFREIYRSQMIDLLLEIGTFLSRCQVNPIFRTRVYKDCMYQFNQIEFGFHSLNVELYNACKYRAWERRDYVIKMRNLLMDIFKVGRPVVWNAFKKHEESRTQMAQAVEAEKQHEEQLMEDLADAPEELQHVVDEPVLAQAPHKFRFPRGRGQGRGRNYRNKDFESELQGDLFRSRGHGGYQPRRSEMNHEGDFHRRHHYRNDNFERPAEGDFYEGYKPPRFKRGH